MDYKEIKSNDNFEDEVSSIIKTSPQKPEISHEDNYK